MEQRITITDQLGDKVALTATYDDAQLDATRATAAVALYYYREATRLSSLLATMDVKQQKGAIPLPPMMGAH